MAGNLCPERDCPWPPPDETCPLVTCPYKREGEMADFVQKGNGSVCPYQDPIHLSSCPAIQTVDPGTQRYCDELTAQAMGGLQIEGPLEQLLRRVDVLEKQDQHGPLGGPFDDLALSRQLLNLNRKQIEWYIQHHAEVKSLLQQAKPLLAKAAQLFASLPE